MSVLPIRFLEKKNYNSFIETSWQYITLVAGNYFISELRDTMYESVLLVERP